MRFGIDLIALDLRTSSYACDKMVPPKVRTAPDGEPAEPGPTCRSDAETQASRNSGED